MNVIVAIDSLKGSLSSLQAGAAAKAGILRAIPDAIVSVKPVADGGEGTVTALVSGLSGRSVTIAVSGPLGETVEAAYGILPDHTAVI
ncbi:MAG: glycerate kinase, partial [Lachnobacterium sp.]|nr:glycerate kinase [Lachnobacterium sp.]